MATIEKLSNIIAQLQADITELKSNTESAVSPIYVNSETISTSSGETYTHTISCDVGNTAISGNLIKLDTPKKFLQVFTSHQSEKGSWEFQVSNTHNSESLGVELSITCIRS